MSVFTTLWNYEFSLLQCLLWVFFTTLSNCECSFQHTVLSRLLLTTLCINKSSLLYYFIMSESSLPHYVIMNGLYHTVYYKCFLPHYVMVNVLFTVLCNHDCSFKIATLNDNEWSYLYILIMCECFLPHLVILSVIFTALRVFSVIITTPLSYMSNWYLLFYNIKKHFLICF
jgi:hypothetical protein